VGLLLTLAVHVLFYCAVLVDPGVLPRHVSTLYAELALPAGGEVRLGGASYLASAVEVSTGATVEVVFCPSCRVWRPPGAHHCKQCGWCVQLLSHHCGFLGVCVGARNVLAFYALQFALVAAQGTALGHALAVLGLALAQQGGVVAVGQVPALLAVLVLVPALALTLGGSVLGARVVVGAAKGPAALRSGRCPAPPPPLVDFAASAGPLLAAMDSARAALDMGKLDPRLLPSGTPWEAACSEALTECLGGTTMALMAHQLSFLQAGACPKGVLLGWHFLPPMLAPPKAR